MKKEDVTIQDILNLIYQNEKKSEQRNIESEQRRLENDQENREAKQRIKETQKQIDEMVAVYKKAGLIQGKVAEETIYRTIAPLFEKKGKKRKRIYESRKKYCGKKRWKKIC